MSFIDITNFGSPNHGQYIKLGDIFFHPFIIYITL